MSADFQLGPWLVSPGTNTITNNGTTVRLEPKVMEVLVCLADHAGEPVSKEALIKFVWPDAFVSDDALTRSISELRRALDDDAREPRFIETISKRGYRILPAVQPVAGRTPPGIAVSAGGNFRTLRIALLTVGLAILVAAIVLGLDIDKIRSRLIVAWTRPGIRSLAVLPLQSLSTDPAQEYFAEGMTDALITDLAQISALKVVSRTTILRYGRPDKPLSQIARELNVDGIVEGTVQRSGDRVRITAQLIYGPADQHLWASSFDRDVKDMLALQADIASEIALHVRAKVLPEEQARLKDLRPVNPKALDACGQARLHLDEADRLEYRQGKWEAVEEHLRKAMAYLDSALEEDPRFMPAYAEAGELLFRQAGGPRLEFLPKAKSTVLRGLELDNTNVELHLALAWILMQYDYDWDGAGREYRKAIELSPNSADAHYLYSAYLQNLGRIGEEKKELDLAEELNPAHDYFSVGASTTDYVVGQRTGRTLEEQRRALEEEGPNDPIGLYTMGKNYAIAGRFKDAVDMFERSLPLLGWSDMANTLKKRYAERGPKFAIEEWMRAVEEYSKTHDDFPVVAAAFTFSSLGNKDRAFAWIDKAIEQRNWCILHLKDDPVWDPLRSDPRFKAVLRRVGLPS